MSWTTLDRPLAERVGFEPTVPRKGDNRFRVCPDRPLWHLSVIVLFYTVGTFPWRCFLSAGRKYSEPARGLLLASIACRMRKLPFTLVLLLPVICDPGFIADRPVAPLSQTGELWY